MKKLQAYLVDNNDQVLTLENDTWGITEITGLGPFEREYATQARGDGAGYFVLGCKDVERTIELTIVSRTNKITNYQKQRFLNWWKNSTLEGYDLHVVRNGRACIYKNVIISRFTTEELTSGRYIMKMTLLQQMPRHTYTPVDATTDDGSITRTMHGSSVSGYYAKYIVDESAYDDTYGINIPLTNSTSFNSFVLEDDIGNMYVFGNGNHCFGPMADITIKNTSPMGCDEAGQDVNNMIGCYSDGQLLFTRPGTLSGQLYYEITIAGDTPPQMSDYPPADAVHAIIPGEPTEVGGL